jgi:hypothetical protein
MAAGRGCPAAYPADRRIEHAAKPVVRHRERSAVRLAGHARLEQGGIAWTQPVQRGERHRLCQIVAEADDLGRYSVPVARRQQHAVADGNVSSQPIDVDDQAGQCGYASFNL